jgi:hypothetical protein
VNVILNETAIAALLETQEGPVGRFVQRVAEAVVVQAQVQFDDYFHGVLPAEQDIDFSMEGSTATIGYVAGKSKTTRLAAAEAAGKLTNPPIRQALDRIRSGG